MRLVALACLLAALVPVRGADARLQIARPAADLSNVGTGDFELRFTLKTDAKQHSAIASQRPVCAHGVFWDIRMLGNGILVAETDGGDYTVLEATRAVNDGKAHAIVLTRRDGTLSFHIDGKPAGAQRSLSNLTELPAVVTGRNPCEGVDGTHALTGTVGGIARTL